MLIKTTNLVDFESLVDGLIENKITDVRIFFSREKRGPSVSFINDRSTPNTAFTYVLCSPIYQVVYADELPNAEFEKTDAAFDSYRQSKGDLLRVQEYESIWFEAGTEILHVKNLAKVY